MPWEAHPASILVEDDIGLDRLSLAMPLLGATGWMDGLGRLVNPPPPGQEAGAALQDTLRDLFAPLGFGLRRLAPQPWEDGVSPALLGTREGGRPTCILHFPLDPPPQAEPESPPPTTPQRLTRQGHRLSGPGLLAVKGAIAAAWAALRVADAVGLPLRYAPVLLFTADAAGLRRAALQGELAGHLISFGGVAGPRRWAGSLGEMEMEIRIVAPPGLSPAAAALPVLDALMTLRGEIALRPAALPGASGAAVRPRLSVLSVRAVQDAAGEAACLLRVLRRFGPQEGEVAVEQELRAVVLAAGAAAPRGCAISLSRGPLLPPVVPEAEGPQARRWEDALRWGFGFGAEPFRCYASAQASALGFAQQAGVQEILQAGLCQPGGEEARPWIEIEAVEALARSLLAHMAEGPGLPV
ncbi:hypothetical protein NON00_19070 [Roseomonas sp. GC11]|uniref:hypothetical protein n=1 Tax=Roseomonas sp. GC11 TaxID=2950546 RepID=UPI00210DCC91|nr:hypothetical protein [Roseomonas sp. GC11]MCQ4162018.1 hypothetical protein [Roseomonas sp. GC11]